MNYAEALDWLFNVRRFGPDRTLGPTRQALGLLGDPHQGFKSIHVGGTNGKGSTSAMIASILGAAGYRVGLFTSPHLERFTERIRVGGEEIPEEDVVRLLGRIRPLFEEMLGQGMPLRFFDIVTILCFTYFRERAVDFAVLEVGLGGRLDATNVVDPLVSVITNIGLEHTEVLGDTLELIAGEKAGIIKPGRTLVTATADDSVFRVFKARADELGCRVVRVGYDTAYERLGMDMAGQRFSLRGLRGEYRGLSTPLLGDYQVVNAATAVAAVESLAEHGFAVPEDAVRRGLRDVHWPGRLEVVSTSPLVVVDGAKDEDATRAVRRTVERDIPHGRLVAVVSISSDKKIPAMMVNIAAVADLVLATDHGVMGRAADPRYLARLASESGKPSEVHPVAEDAFARALELAGPGGMVLVVGSVFLAGAARAYFRGPGAARLRAQPPP
jgi:dihydrofolate synthase/folylpolyglutamate synthase